MVLGEVQARPGWEATATATSVVWQGGRIPPGQFETFSLLATATGRPKVLPFRVQESFSDGTVDRYRPTVHVVPAASLAAAQPGAGRDSGARTLGKFALAIALAAAAGVVLLAFVLLGAWLISPWDKRDDGSGTSPRTTETDLLTDKEARHQAG
jgi:hypothetical protein